MARVDELKNAVANLDKEVGETADEVRKLRDEIQALKDQIGDDVELEQEVDNVIAHANEIAARLDALQTQSTPTPEEPV